MNPPPGSDEETAFVKKVMNAFHPFSYGNVTLKFPEAYAESFYFRDAFHVFTDRDTMVAYMQRTAQQSPGVTFEFEAPGRNGIDFYLPWVMVLPARDGGDPQRSVGVSRLRFNEDGQVIFHQDYWDSADVLVRRVPVANGLIELVRRRF
ncbi:MAG: nuclear transport factor 2 family protein [Kiritimatiellae bacterium]|nr:nuclear transport factor 2 family protein [Kiritimatiellia bacterium]